jgi:hypothetical protein
MKQHPINYIGFNNKSVLTNPIFLYQTISIRKYFNSFIIPGPVENQTQESYTKDLVNYYDQKYGLPLLPLDFWYDKIHIARKSYYLEVIFHRKGFFN